MQRNLIVKEVDIHICFLKHFINAFVWAKARWCRTGLIFREVEVNSIGGVSMLVIQLLIRHDSKSSNCYTTAPLVINQAQLDWPRRANRRTQARKCKHAIWYCKYEWSESKRGSRTRFQRTNRHSGGDQERGLWITVKGLVATVTTNQSLFSRRKTQELNKTLV